MSQTFVKTTRVPVTKISTRQCVVTAVKEKKKDGYHAVQMGFGQKKLKNVTDPLKGHLKGAINKSTKTAPRFLREVKLDEKPKVKVGDSVKASDIFNVGDIVQVTGVGKGRGFQGVVKRWGFKTSGRSHGQKGTRRSPGSIGQGTDPGRVHKGKKMAGRMGGKTTTVKNLIVMDVDDEENLISLSGPVPGRKGTLLVIRKTAEGKRSDLIKETPAEVAQQEVPEEELETETGSQQKPEKQTEDKQESKEEQEAESKE